MVRFWLQVKTTFRCLYDFLRLHFLVKQATFPGFTDISDQSVVSIMRSSKPTPKDKTSNIQAQHLISSMLKGTHINCTLSQSIYQTLSTKQKKLYQFYFLRKTLRSFTSISLNGISSFPVCVCICVAPSAFSPDDSDVFCIIWSVQLHYSRKFNKLSTVVERDLLVTMDTAEASPVLGNEEVKGLWTIFKAVTILRCVAQVGIRKIRLIQKKEEEIKTNSNQAP